MALHYNSKWLCVINPNRRRSRHECTVSLTTCALMVCLFLRSSFVFQPSFKGFHLQSKLIVSRAVIEQVVFREYHFVTHKILAST